MISHCFGTSAQFFQSNAFLTPSLGSRQFHLLSQGVRIQMSTFVQSEVPDNIFVVSILNSENQLISSFRKTFLLLCVKTKMSNIKIHTVAFTCHLLGPINPGLDIGRSPSTRIPDLSFPVRSSSTKTYFPINVFGELNH